MTFQTAAVDKAEQGHVHLLFYLDKTVVGDCLGEISPELTQNAVLIVVFETFVPAEVVEDGDGHDLGRGQAAFHGGEFFFNGSITDLADRNFSNSR